MKPRGAIINTSDPLAKGLIGAWLINEGAGLSAIDYSGFKNHGTHNGTIPWLFDLDGPKADFTNSASNYISIPHIAAYDVKTITVACYMSTDSTSTLKTAVSKWNDTDKVFLLGNGTVSSTHRFGAYVGGSLRGIDSATTFFATGVKKMLVGVADTVNSLLYVDGELAATHTLGSPAPKLLDSAPAPIRIGGRDSGTQPWDGTVDTVYIWNYALSEADIAKLAFDPWRMFRRKGFVFMSSSAVPLTGITQLAFSTSFALDAKGTSPAVGLTQTAISSSVAFLTTGIQSESSIVLAVSETYDILKAESTPKGEAFVFEVGQFNLFKAKLPMNVWNDVICEWPYKSIGFCDYGRDEFEGLSQINIKDGGDGAKTQGWVALNFASAGVISADVHITNNNFLQVTMSPTVDFSWKIGKIDAPFYYKLFDPTDFDIEISVSGDPIENGEGEGFLVTGDNDNTQDWIFFRRVLKNGSFSLIITKTEDGLTESTIYEQVLNNRLLRVVKVGSTFSFFARESDVFNWGNSIATTSQTDLDNVKLRLGLCSVTGSSSRSNNYQAKFDYYRLLSGGLTDCDRTLGGPNGCRVHKNTRRFGGAPGILHGPLVL